MALDAFQFPEGSNGFIGRPSWLGEAFVTVHMAGPHATAADGSSNCSPQLLDLRSWRVSPLGWVTLIAQDFQLLVHFSKGAAGSFFFL